MLSCAPVRSRACFPQPPSQPQTIRLLLSDAAHSRAQELVGQGYQATLVAAVLAISRSSLYYRKQVTITHVDSRRHFLLLSEAARLVLLAGALGQGGEIFYLDPGKPVRILDLAKNLIRLFGLEPGEEVPVKVIGLRPGEKLRGTGYGRGHHSSYQPRKGVCNSEFPPGPKSILEGIGALAALGGNPGAQRRRSATQGNGHSVLAPNEHTFRLSLYPYLPARDVLCVVTLWFRHTIRTSTGAAHFQQFEGWIPTGFLAQLDRVEETWVLPLLNKLFF